MFLLIYVTVNIKTVIV